MPIMSSQWRLNMKKNQMMVIDMSPDIFPGSTPCHKDVMLKQLCQTCPQMAYSRSLLQNWPLKTRETFQSNKNKNNHDFCLNESMYVSILSTFNNIITILLTHFNY